VLNITFTISPTPEHRQVKRRNRKFEHNQHRNIPIEDEDKVNEEEEKEVLNYGNVNTVRKKKKYQNPRALVPRAEFNTRPRTSLNNSIAGNYFPIPYWTKQAGISNPPSDFLDMKFACRKSAIIWSLMDENQRKHPNRDSVIRKILSQVIFPSDDIQDDKIYFRNFMELNPKYYIVVLSFEGMNRYIEKNTVLANFSKLIHPPIYFEGKTPIYLLLVTYKRPYYNDISEYIHTREPELSVEELITKVKELEKEVLQ
jgi:hypothetical protein